MRLCVSPSAFMTPAEWLTSAPGVHSLGRHNKTHMSEGSEWSFHHTGGYWWSICVIGFRVMEMFFMSALLWLFGLTFWEVKSKDGPLVNGRYRRIQRKDVRCPQNAFIQKLRKVCIRLMNVFLGMFKSSNVQYFHVRSSQRGTSLVNCSLHS